MGQKGRAGLGLGEGLWGIFAEGQEHMNVHTRNEPSATGGDRPGTFFFFFFCFLGLLLWHMEVPRLRVQSELQLLAYTTATATSDPSRVCDLHRSSRQHQILNPLREARDQT